MRDGTYVMRVTLRVPDGNSVEMSVLLSTYEPALAGSAQIWPILDWAM